MDKPTFNQRKYIIRQKSMMRSLTKRPNVMSLLGKVIMCKADKPEWIMICNSNKWDS